MFPLTRRWTNEDIAKLKLMAAAGHSATRCAAALKRKVGSVKKQARLLGCELPGVRAVRAEQRTKISDAEKVLPTGARRYDGSVVP